MPGADFTLPIIAAVVAVMATLGGIGLLFTLILVLRHERKLTEELEKLRSKSDL